MGHGAGLAAQDARHDVLRGTIASVAFASGDRFVAGIWAASPLGPFADVMWARPDGRRILLAPTDAVAAYVTAVYRFDDVRVSPVDARDEGSAVRVRAGTVEYRVSCGARRAVLPRRPWSITRFVERPVARRLLGVETFGTSPTGAREWYQATSWRYVRDAHGTVDGHDLGAMAARIAPTHFGFSEPPARPSVVRLRARLEFD
jgi:hypothetical protein